MRRSSGRCAVTTRTTRPAAIAKDLLAAKLERACGCMIDELAIAARHLDGLRLPGENPMLWGVHGCGILRQSRHERQAPF